MGKAPSVAVQNTVPNDPPSFTSGAPIKRTVRIIKQLAGGASMTISPENITAADTFDYLATSTPSRFGSLYVVSGRCWLTTQDGTTAATTTLGPPRLSIQIAQAVGQGAGGVIFTDTGTAIRPAAIGWTWTKLEQAVSYVTDATNQLVKVINTGLATKTAVVDVCFIGAPGTPT